MSYTAEISRNNPSCFLFLIDQSGSMDDPFGAGESSKKKKDGVADAINRLLYDLVIKCSKGEEVRDYYHVGVIGYGAKTEPAFSGALAERDLVPLSEIAKTPARIEQRTKKFDDGAGGIMERPVKFPVWFDATAYGGTPMRKVIQKAKSIVEGWLGEHPDCFPPIIINITDGESTDGSPSSDAEALKGLKSSDGDVLLFNVHLSEKKGTPIEFPDSQDNLPDKYAKLLFEMSSVLPPHMREIAQTKGYTVSGNSRGFVFNAELTSVISFLNIGTQPSNLR